MSKNLRSVDPTESQIQCAIVEWANNTPFCYRYKKIGNFLLSIPNGGKREKFKNYNGKIYCPSGNKLKKEGQRKGASDLFLAIPRDIYTFDKTMIISFARGQETRNCGLWIEIKSKNGKLSMDQSRFFEDMKSVAYSCVLVRTVDEGIQAIKDYLGMN